MYFYTKLKITLTRHRLPVLQTMHEVKGKGKIRPFIRRGDEFLK